MTKQDTDLAEALWVRSKEFARQKEYYNALLDIGAACRLFSLSQDPRAEEAHQEWMQAYQQHAEAVQAAQASKTEAAAKLEGLLNQVESKRRR